MKINKIIIGLVVGAGVLASTIVGVASAHVVVKPSDARTAAYQTFLVSVPTERDSSTVSIKLTIPEDLVSVRPTVKPGWTIQTEKQGTGENTMVKTITWAGGQIGAGYRDEFTFSAKTPNHPMDLQWKVSQTYQDGTVVSWDQPVVEDTDKEDATTGPFSVTKVAADSDQDIALRNAGSKADGAQQAANMALYTGIGGIILAFAAIIIILPRLKTKL